MAGLTAVMFGIVAYGFSLVSLLYLVGFMGNLIVPKSIDVGAGGPLLQSVIIDAALIGLFAIQHSVMARRGFKRWWTRIVSPSIERSTYVLSTSVVLLILYWLWQPIPATVWSVHNPIAVTALHGIFWLGWAVLVGSTFLINHFELFGLSQVFARLFGRQSSEPEFRTPLLYRYVRHPIYLGVTLAIWSTPNMTAGHLLFSAAITVYTLIAIQLEENDLIEQYGDQYRHYRQQAAMLVPLPGRRSPQAKEGNV